MGLVMAVDPGLRGCGVSGYQDGVLQWAGYVANPVRTERGPAAWRAMARAVADAYPLAPDVLVLEGQYVPPSTASQRKRRRVNPADILELCGVIGALTGIYDALAGEIIRYLPSQWTGGEEKTERHARIQTELTPEELSRITMPIPSLRHNVWDAVALGLYEAKKRKERGGADGSAAESPV